MPSTHDPSVDPHAVCSFAVDGERGLRDLARRVADALPTVAFVTLRGDLGAGKTTFVKAVADAVGIDAGDVVSPTFGLIHVHQVPAASGRPERIVHADLYRLAGAEDLAETGWEDVVSGPGWVFVEWPDRAPAALPDRRLDISIRIDSESGRTFAFAPHGGFPLPRTFFPS